VRASEKAVRQFVKGNKRRISDLDDAQDDRGEKLTRRWPNLISARFLGKRPVRRGRASSQRLDGRNSKSPGRGKMKAASVSDFRIRQDQKRVKGGAGVRTDVGGTFIIHAGGPGAVD